MTSRSPAKARITGSDERPMTPAARIAAAIDVLDRVAAGSPAEKALLTWSRGARYAGSKDRAAVRDHVFEALRRWRSSAQRGGAETGRGRMIGLLREAGVDPAALFTGEGHAPAPLSEAERAGGTEPEGLAAWDIPDWLGDAFARSLGAQAGVTANLLRHRAPVGLRVNILKSNVDQAITALAEQGISAVPCPLSPTALIVQDGARKVARSAAYLGGQVELQDAASQAVVDALPLVPGAHVLDFCAGGGGKALAISARLGGRRVFAHDADPARMRDLPDRARRAGADIDTVAAPAGRYDLVLADAPCSGSGAWRRAPEGKWRLTPDRLAELCATQAAILDTCATYVAPGGVLAYATCSLLEAENAGQAAGFLARHSEWRETLRQSFALSEENDGLFVVCFSK